MRNSAVPLLALVTTVFFVAMAHAQNSEPLAQVEAGSSLVFVPKLQGHKYSLTIAGEGFWSRDVFEAGTQPSFQPYDQNGELLPDGSYKFELCELPAVEASLADRGRRAKGAQLRTQTGTVQISGGFLSYSPSQTSHKSAPTYQGVTQ
jgi:hypothetical protein